VQWLTQYGCAKNRRRLSASAEVGKLNNPYHLSCGLLSDRPAGADSAVEYRNCEEMVGKLFSLRSYTLPVNCTDSLRGCIWAPGD
jgi:hypothetical protein